jgi:hypothetical protein
MKFAKLFIIALITVFAVSMQSEAGLKKDLKKLTKDKKESKEKKETKAANQVKCDYSMNDDSDMESDIKKLLPAKSEYNHRITEGLFGPADGSKGPILIVPYITGDNGKVQLMLLIPVESKKYNKMMLGEIKFGASNAQEVLSVFFDQADKDKERELFVLCAYDKGNRTFYETAVYNWNKTKFERVPALEAKVKNQYPAINVRRVLRAMEAKK